MKLSIIVPVYNAEKYLSRCLDSIINQTFKDFELLIVNDGSTDNSKDIINEYVNNDIRVKAFHVNNGGVSKARNIGINNASGDYIAFVDSDDYIKPNMYEKLIDVLNKHNVEIVTSNLLINGKEIKNNIKPNIVYTKKRVYEEVLPLFTYDNSIGTYEFKNKIIIKELLEKNNIRFNEGFSYQEDLMFMIEMFFNANSLYYIDEVFYEYYPISFGLYSSYRENGGMKFIEAHKLINLLISEYSININKYNYENSFLYNISYYIYRTTNRVKDNKKQKQLIRDILNNETVIDSCLYLKDNATSFDKRIARAIYDKKQFMAILLIKFVYSGKASFFQEKIKRIYGN